MFYFYPLYLPYTITWIDTTMFIKKFIILFFAIHFLSNGLLTKELAKVPFLFTHYYEHKEINRNLSFVDFLKMHYISNLKTDPQLPFQPEKHSLVSHFLFFAKQTLPIFIKNIYQPVEKNKPYNINILFDGFLSILLQPPK